MSVEILKLTDICKDYQQGKDPVRVLKNINMTVHKGDYLAIMGPSGSGKTTLMSEYNDNISKSQEDIVALLQERGVDAVIGTHPHFVHKMTYDPETGNFVAYSLGDLISNADRAGTEYSVILNLEITKTDENTKITGFSYTPIFTVAERGSTLRTVRVAESMTAYDLSHISRVNLTTYDAMAYALERIEARVKGE